ncbi:MAG: DUF721 domain-containing protein [Chlamydiota bacterium]
MAKKVSRTPRGYDGVALTSHQLSDVLSAVMSGIGSVYENRGDLVLAAWAEIIGPQFSTMTEAVSFYDNVLVVKVKNSSLYSLLSQYHKRRILNSLRKKFPGTDIRNILFRIG